MLSRHKCCSKLGVKNGLYLLFLKFQFKVLVRIYKDFHYLSLKELAITPIFAAQSYSTPTPVYSPILIHLKGLLSQAYHLFTNNVPICAPSPISKKRTPRSIY